MTDESRAILSTKIATRSNQLVRDIVVGFVQRIGTDRAVSDEHVTVLRVLVGMAMREAAMIGADYGARRAVQHTAPKPAVSPRPPRISPPRVDDVPLVFDDRTTQKMPRHPDHGDE